MFVLNIPTVSLLLGQIALVFLFILAAFPRADFKQIVINSAKYLAFIAFCYTIIAFLPLPDSKKLLIIESYGDGFPNVISVNLIVLVLINVITFAVWGVGIGDYLLALVFRPKSEEPKLNPQFSQITAPKSELAKASPKPDIRATKAEEVSPITPKPSPKEISKSLRGEVDSLFDLYFRDHEEGTDQKNENLEHLENAVLNNMDLHIKGVLCIDKSGKILQDTIFHWDGPALESMLALFKKHNEISNNLGTANLCQLLINAQRHWYMLAKYRGNLLILKSGAVDPGILLEMTYKVFKSL